MYGRFAARMAEGRSNAQLQLMAGYAGIRIPKQSAETIFSKSGFL